MTSPLGVQAGAGAPGQGFGAGMGQAFGGGATAVANGNGNGNGHVPAAAAAAGAHRGVVNGSEMLAAAAAERQRQVGSCVVSYGVSVEFLRSCHGFLWVSCAEFVEDAWGSYSPPLVLFAGRASS